MPPRIVLSGLSAATPDGRPLFTDLDLTFSAERTGLVGRNGVGKSTLLAVITGALPPRAGKATVTGTVGVLRQAVRPAPDETIADLFKARQALAALARAERGEATADELAIADWTLEPRIAAALERAGLGATTDTPLAHLSGGQVTRAALAALVFEAPDFLILDEPTNNLDHDGRAAVRQLLTTWRGGAIVVSHDRNLLEEMDTIVELTTLGARRYGGNWSRYRERKAEESATAEATLAEAQRRVTTVALRAQISRERQASRNSAGRRKAAKGDAPKILLGSRKSGSEKTAGNITRLGDRQSAEARRIADEARAVVEILQPFEIDLPSTGLSPPKTVLSADNLTAGYAGRRPIIRNLTLELKGPERVAIVGTNGTGKSTLLSVVAGRLRPSQGAIAVHTRFAFLDQSVSILQRQGSVQENFARLNPEMDENACRAALARFRFRADAALQSVGTLSGGETLRAGLACVLGGRTPPPLLIMDEPTNHLDIDSTETVEAGLRAYDGALLVVSHDEAFLRAIGITRHVSLGIDAGNHHVKEIDARE